MRRAVLSILMLIVGGFCVAPTRSIADPAAVSDAASAAISDTANGRSLGQVIVTAQKYSQRAFDVPMSLAVIGDTELQKLVVTNIENLETYVPGLTIESTGQSLYVSIRGISNFSGTGALVGSYLDEADVTTDDALGLTLSTYDMERIEVLRGPQGTLYGEGSVGGTIRYITNKPNLTDVQALAHITGLFDQYGAPGDRVEAVLNTPLINDVLGLRVAVDFDREGGWVDQPDANLKNINKKDVTDGRIEGRWKPMSTLTIDATEVLHLGTEGPWTGEDANGNFTQAFDLTTTPITYDRFNVTNMTVSWELSGVRLLNSATYFKHDDNAVDQGNIGYQFTPPPSPTFDFYSSSRVIDESISDEFRFSDTDSGPWRWTVGAFFRRFTDNLLPTTNYFALHAPTLPPSYSTYGNIRSKSWSGFGDTSYRFGKLVLGTGVRYFRDDQNALLFGDLQRETQTFSSVDPRFYVRYGVSRQVNVYASAAKGFRSGGFNGDGAPTFEPEHVWTYELGTKLRLLSDRLSVNADIFLSNYSGYQVFGFVQKPEPANLYSNAGTARIKGSEAELMWRPISHWLIGLSGDYINARFVAIAATSTAYVVGDPLDLTPRYQITASLERDFLWGGRAGYARVDYSQRARETFRNRANGPWYYSQSNYIYMLNFNVGIDLNADTRVALFVQNLLNDRGYTGADVEEDAAERARPRTLGIELTYGAQ